MVSRVSLLPDAFGSDRVAVVNYLVRHREAFLPLVYDHWKQKRTKVEG
jgi:hypothetical protein